MKAVLLLEDINEYHRNFEYWCILAVGLILFLMLLYVVILFIIVIYPFTFLIEFPTALLKGKFINYHSTQRKSKAKGKGVLKYHQPPNQVL